MTAKDMLCQTCADAGLPQRYNWVRSDLPGVMTCSQCQHTTDFRFKHAEVSGGNKFLRLIEKFGKSAFRCKADGKWAFPNWENAREYATAYGQRAYNDDRCGFIHLTSQLR